MPTFAPTSRQRAPGSADVVAPAPLREWAEARAFAYSRAQKHRQDTGPASLPADWQGWLAAVFGSYLRPPFAAYHAEFWEWVWSLEAGQSARPFVAIWPRGFGKSSSAEAACAAVAARGARSYVMYISGTQSQADDHVKSTAKLFLSEDLARHYPAVGRRGMTKYHVSEGWRRDRIVTASGFVVDALGLDTAARGVKWGNERPDLFIVDDIDDPLDTAKTTEKNVTMLTQSLLPAGAPHAAVVVIQNLIHKNGIVARLADGRADFLGERKVSGPHPAVIDPEFVNEGGTWRIASGVSTWAAMTLAKLSDVLNRIGLRAFKRELQHEVNDAEGALWSQDVIDEHREADGVPDGIALARVVIGVDPPGATAECGIVGVGRGTNKRGYVLGDWSRVGAPNAWGIAVVAAYDSLHADAVVVETNFGGPMATQVIRSIRPGIKIVEVHASRGKAVRAEPVSAAYDQGRCAHVGYFPQLEDEMTGWVPGGPSPNRLDALVWACTDLGLVVTGAEPPDSKPALIAQPSRFARPGAPRASLVGRGGAGRFGR